MESNFILKGLRIDNSLAVGTYILKYIYINQVIPIPG